MKPNPQTRRAFQPALGTKSVLSAQSQSTVLALPGSSQVHSGIGFFFFFYPAFQHWLTKSQREPMNGLLKVEEMKLVFPVVRCLGCIGTGCTWCKSERKCIHPFTACDPLDYERNQVEWPALCDQALPEMNVCASLLPPVFCTRSVPGVAHLSAG